MGFIKKPRCERRESKLRCDLDTIMTTGGETPDDDDRHSSFLAGALYPFPKFVEMASALRPPNENEVGISLRQAADIARRRILALLDRCEKLRGGHDEVSTGSWVEWMPALVGDPWVCSAGATTVERSAAVVAQVLYSLDAAALLDPRCLGVGEITSVEDGRHRRHAIRNYRFRCVC